VVSLVALAVSSSILGLILYGEIGFYVVPTTSMEPTLHPNDRIVAVATSGHERGQVVVVRDPENRTAYLVKRIVGIPGDRVEVFGNRLVVNGKMVAEPYLSEPIAYQLPPTEVPHGEVFLLGDNRNESEDSHLWKRGVPVSDIVGVVRYIYSPGERRGTRVGYPEVFRGTANAKPAAGAAAETESNAP
jgi:signal peptidase I